MCYISCNHLRMQACYDVTQAENHLLWNYTRRLHKPLLLVEVFCCSVESLEESPRRAYDGPVLMDVPCHQPLNNFLVACSGNCTLLQNFSTPFACKWI
jgi:hypothetical protein